MWDLDFTTLDHLYEMTPYILDLTRAVRERASIIHDASSELITVADPTPLQTMYSVRHIETAVLSFIGQAQQTTLFDDYRFVDQEHVNSLSSDSEDNAIPPFWTLDTMIDAIVPLVPTGPDGLITLQSLDQFPVEWALQRYHILDRLRWRLYQDPLKYHPILVNDQYVRLNNAKTNFDLRLGVHVPDDPGSSSSSSSSENTGYFLPPRQFRAEIYVQRDADYELEDTIEASVIDDDTIYISDPIANGDDVIDYYAIVKWDVDNGFKYIETEIDSSSNG